MTPSDDHQGPLDDQVAQWRGYLRHRRTLHSADLEALEGHLRNDVAALTAAGLAGDEAFLVAVKRLGDLDLVSREFAREHAERLWKQLVMAAPVTSEEAAATRTEVAVVLALAVTAALAIKVPAFFGAPLGPDHDGFYLRHLSLFVLPLLTGYFAWKRRVGVATCLWLALPFAAAAVFANVFPFGTGSHTGILTALHLPIALWFVVGVAYAGGRWFSGERRMDFVRFSGELFIYYVLLALGGGVLTAMTLMMFNAIDVNVGWVAGQWLVPCGAMGAVLIGAWLVEAKQRVIENMAPVLTRVFTPLFIPVLIVFLGIMAWTRSPIDVGREVLIQFDLLLVLVVGLVLYSASARDPQAPPDVFDRLQVLLVVSALAVDAVALWAIATRISEFGLSPNRVAALGENLILLVNLLGTAWLSTHFLRGNRPFAALEQWQVSFLSVYPAWATFVVIAFPPLFGYQ